MLGARSAPACEPPANAPTAATLRQAALAHLAQHATTRAGLIRVLDRRVARWANATASDPDETASLRQAVRQVADQLLVEGLLDDRAFADARAQRLARAGRSRRTIAAHLAARGVGSEVVKAALPDTELAAAVATSRRRRIGPFRASSTDAQDHARELAMLARAGFSRAIATAALALPVEQAELILLQLRRG